MPVADFDPVRSRMSQIKASWKTESPNCEKNWALQRNAIGAGARRGPALVASDPLGFGGCAARFSDLLRGRSRLELGSVVLEVPHERRLDSQLAEIGVELATVMQVLVVDDLDADEPREALTPRRFAHARDLLVGQRLHSAIGRLPAIGRVTQEVLERREARGGLLVVLIRPRDLPLGNALRDRRHRGIHVHDELLRRAHVLAWLGFDLVLRDRLDPAQRDPVDGPEMIPPPAELGFVHSILPTGSVRNGTGLATRTQRHLGRIAQGASCAPEGRAVSSWPAP